MTLPVKKVIMVDPYYWWFVDELLCHDIDVIGIFTDRTEKKGLSQFDATKFSDVYYLDHNYDEILAALKKERIDAVLLGLDVGTDIYLRLMHDLNIPNTNALALRKILTNKFTVNQHLQQQPIPVAKQLLVDKNHLHDQIQQATDTIGFPCIVKPVHSRGSFGFHICEDQAALLKNSQTVLNAIDGYSQSVKALVIEELLVGTEYAVATVSQGGKHAFAAIFESTQYLIEGHNFMRSSRLRDPNDQSMQSIRQYVTDVLDGIGFVQGQALTEVMLTKKGPRLVEINPRIAGLDGKVDSLAQTCTGMSPVKLAVLSYTDPHAFAQYVEKPCSLKQHGLFLFLRNYTDTTVKTREKIEAIKRLPSCINTYIPAQLDDTLKKTRDFTTCAGYLILSHPDQNIIDKDIKTIEQFEKTGLFV